MGICLKFKINHFLIYVLRPASVVALKLIRSFQTRPLKNLVSNIHSHVMLVSIVLFGHNVMSHVMKVFMTGLHIQIFIQIFQTALLK